MSEMFEKEAVYEMLKESKRIEKIALELDWDVAEIMSQATQELGEFSEACMIKHGTIRHKQLDHLDHPFEEGADVMICVLDALSRLYPEKPASEIYCLFLFWMDRKCKKWVNKVENEYQEVVINDKKT